MAATLDTATLDMVPDFGIWGGGYDTSRNVETIRSNHLMLESIATTLSIGPAPVDYNVDQSINYYLAKIEELHEMCLESLKIDHRKHRDKLLEKTTYGINYLNRYVYLPKGHYPILTNKMLEALSTNYDAVWLFMGTHREFKVIFPNVFSAYPNLIAFSPLDPGTFDPVNRTYRITSPNDSSSGVSFHIVKMTAQLILNPQKSGQGYLFFADDSPFSPERSEQILNAYLDNTSNSGSNEVCFTFPPGESFRTPDSTNNLLNEQIVPAAPAGNTTDTTTEPPPKYSVQADSASSLFDQLLGLLNLDINLICIDEAIRLTLNIRNTVFDLRNNYDDATAFEESVKGAFAKLKHEHPEIFDLLQTLFKTNEILSHCMLSNGNVETEPYIRVSVEAICKGLCIGTN